ncbi:MAG: ahpC/TSA family protein [Akkermansiaceae bacterium]|nr:ahpC/TSA family protein [Akkermansiaceae bacterium]
MKFAHSLALLAACAVPVFAADKKKEEAAPLPNASVSQIQFTPVVNEVPFDKASLEGKVVVVDEWGVNCGPCIASLPEMAKMAKSLESKGVAFVGIEVQHGTNDQINKLLKDAHVKYPVMAGGSSGVSSSYIPHVCIFGVDGKLVWHGNPGDDGFKKSLREAMKDVVVAKK